MDPSTEVVCLCYTLDGWATFEVWAPTPELDVTRRSLAALVSNPEIMFVAHNASFEMAIWRNQMVTHYGFEPIPTERFDCTMAACAWKGMPLKLDATARALRMPISKDGEGRRLTLGLSKPQRATKKFPLRGGMLPELTPAVRNRVIEYCGQDVAVEHGVRQRVGLISQQSRHERGIWLLDQEINQRGVKLDMAFVDAAQAVVDKTTGPLTEEFRDLTSGINPTQREKIVTWCENQGVFLDNLQKDYVTKLLKDDEETDDAGYESLADDGGDLPTGCKLSLPSEVRRVLDIRQMLGSASIKKLARMAACVSFNGRAHGLVQYHAAATGRWGGRLFQPQNFPRGALGALKIDPETAVDAIMSGDPAEVERRLGLPAIECVSSSLRHALVADHRKVFNVGDYAGIEARIVLALAGQYDKCTLLASGFDVYLDMAELIYNIPKGTWAVTDPEQLELIKKLHVIERTIGKNTILGCGFQMGGPKFNARYCPEQPPEFAAAVVKTYREDWAPKVPDLWYALERAALRAVTTGKPQEAYGVRYEITGEFLVATLPSKWQRLWYFRPRLSTSKFGKPCWQYQQMKQNKWITIQAYGGLLTENVVQALARGLLCAAMVRINPIMPIVLTVHDEIVSEVDECLGNRLYFGNMMAEPTEWSAALQIPVNVETWEGPRYRK